MVFVIDLTWPFSSHICCFITFMADVLCVVDFQAGSFPSGDRPAPPQPEQRKEKTLSSNGSCCSSLPPPLALGHGRYGLFTLSHHIKKIKITLTYLWFVVLGRTQHTFVSVKVKRREWKMQLINELRRLTTAEPIPLPLE